MQEIRNYIMKPLVLIGALNWGFIGLFGFDLVAFLFGSSSKATMVVYSIIGIAAAVYIIMMLSPNKTNR